MLSSYLGGLPCIKIFPAAGYVPISIFDRNIGAVATVVTHLSANKTMIFRFVTSVVTSYSSTSCLWKYHSWAFIFVVVAAAVAAAADADAVVGVGVGVGVGVVAVVVVVVVVVGSLPIKTDR